MFIIVFMFYENDKAMLLIRLNLHTRHLLFSLQKEVPYDNDSSAYCCCYDCDTMRIMSKPQHTKNK